MTSDYATGPAHRLRHHAEWYNDSWIEVAVYVREIVSPDPTKMYRYDSIGVRNYQGNGDIPMNFPPVIGDWMIIEKLGSVRVVGRQWMLSQYGSVYWPPTEQRPVKATPAELDCGEIGRPVPVGSRA